ncbi:MAG: hybrid sensor histidine kinase/response regulator [Syntrophorhabdaceae bacterium]
MKLNDAHTESIKLQWNFYERTINNYSVIMRVMKAAEDNSLIREAPKIFVEESFFDMCAIILEKDGKIHQGSYSIDDTLESIDYYRAASLCTSMTSATTAKDIFGYGLVYLYPFRDNTKTIGYLILGKRFGGMLEAGLVRELEIIAEICNMSLIQGHDVSHSKEIHSPSFFESVLESFPDPLILVDINGLIGYANKGAKDTFETSKGFLLGEKATKAIAGLPEDLVRNRLPFQGQINYKSPNDYKFFEVRSFIVSIEGQSRDWLAIVFKDVVTAKVNEEEQFLRKRNESVGMLAGGIAHDFNNMLTGVLGYAALMKRMVSDEKLRRYAEAIEHSARRASGLTRHLLNFSRRQKKSTGVIEINPLLEDVLFLLKESFHNIIIEKQFEDALPNIRGDEAQLQNVFLNLFINSKDAMEGTGTLRVQTSTQAGEYVCIGIEDTGKGIDETLRHKIFEPYFSTKDNVLNLGMGLYLVDKVVKEHGGFIDISSESQKGTCFFIYLPISTGHNSKEKTRQSSQTINKLLDKKFILVVDDESLVRELLKNVLGEYGAQVIEAENGEKGLEIYRQYGNKIDLIILDVIMPGIKGDEVLCRIREDDPAAKVIISSGFMSEEQRAKLREYHVHGFLDKPFKDEDVFAIIREIFDKMA